MHRKPDCKLNNKGVTLIGLVVVILLMGIMATALVLNIGTIFGRSARDAATKLSSLLDRMRIEAINRVADQNGYSNAFLRISKETDNYVAKIVYVDKDGNETDGDSEVLGNSSLTVTAVVDEATLTGTQVSDSTSVELHFKKSTGAFTTINPADSEYKSIAITGRNTAQVVLVWETGRNYVVND